MFASNMICPMLPIGSSLYGKHQVCICTANCVNVNIIKSPDVTTKWTGLALSVVSGFPILASKNMYSGHVGVRQCAYQCMYRCALLGNWLLTLEINEWAGKGKNTEVITFTNILAVTTIRFNVRGDHNVPRGHAGFCFQSKSIHVAEN